MVGALENREKGGKEKACPLVPWERAPGSWKSYPKVGRVSRQSQASMPLWEAGEQGFQ